MKRTKPPAFVLGLGPNGYGLVRSLYREGVPVLGFHYTREHFGRFSRLIRSRYLDRTRSAEQIASILIECSREFKQRPVLLAASDEFAFLIAQRRDQLAEHFAFHRVAGANACRVFDKSEMTQLGAQAGVTLPQTYVTDPAQDIGRAARTFMFPCIIKPLRSFGTAFPRGTKNYVAVSHAALLQFYERRPDLIGVTLWQQLIEGSDAEIVQCNVLIGEAGEVRAICGVRKLRQYPPGVGNMCFGRTEVDPVAGAQALKLLRFLQYRGLASIEFKRHPEEDRYYFIEMNARLPWYCAVFADAGVNLPYLAYLDLTVSGRAPCTGRQQNGVHWMCARDDLRSILGTRGPGLRTILLWALSITRTRCFAWWMVRDPAPFLRSTLSWLRSAVVRRTAPP